MPNQALRADLLMLLTALIWGSAFIAQRLGMDHIGPFLYTGLRFSLAALVLLPFVLRRPAGKQLPGEPLLYRGLLMGGAVMGLVLALGINLQQVGLLFTSVTNAGFITGLYVIIVPLIGLFLGHKAGLGIWFGASMAVLGMFLLCVGENFAARELRPENKEHNTKIRQDETSQERIRQDKRQDTIRQDKTRHDKARPDKKRQRKTSRDNTRQKT